MSEALIHDNTLCKPFVMWFTGLPSSGKSTLARAMTYWLNSLGAKVEHLDGDEVRSVFPQTGFSRDERNMHLKRIGFLAQRLERNGIAVVCSFVSPYAESRNDVRSMCCNFIEVYVEATLAECERRDVKGLYKKARQGEITGFTGVDDVYEPPSAAEVTLRTADESVDECLDRLKEYLSGRGLAGK